MRINAEVLGEQPSIIKFVEVEKEKIITIKEPSFIVKIWLWIKNIFK